MLGLLIIVISFASFSVLSDNYINIANDSALKISKTYLKEVSESNSISFEVSLQYIFSSLQFLNDSMNNKDYDNISALQADLSRAKNAYDYDFLGLISDKGECINFDSVFNVVSRIKILNKLYYGETDIISFDEKINNKDMILFGTSINSINLFGKNIVGIVAGLNLSDCAYRLAITNNATNVRTYVISRDGKFVVKTEPSEINALNLFSYFEQNVDFYKDYSLDSLIDGINNNYAGVTIYTDDNQQHLLFYQPIKDGELYLISLVTQSYVDDVLKDTASQMSDLGKYLVITISLFLICFLIIVFLNERYNNRLLLEKEKSEKERDVANAIAKEKSIFLAQMSHDIRTPLNGIVGMNRMALNEIDKSNTKLYEMISLVGTSAKYLEQLVNDVLDLSKIDENKLEIVKKGFVLEKTINTLISIFNHQIEEKNLDVEIEIDDDILGKTYLFDEKRLQQILMNIVSNSIKFTSEYGKISLKVIKKEDTEIDFVISDTGVGMSEEFLENLFLPYSQENSNIQYQFGGTGLGMSIVKNLVDLLEGSVEVESKKGVGTTFTLRFKMPEIDCKNEFEVCDLSFINFTGKKILVAEDNQINAKIIINILENWRCSVVWAKDGLEVLDYYNKNEDCYFDAILMDIRMPNLDGYNATERIRKSGKKDANDIVIIAMSANAFESDIETSKKMGMQEHLIKPLNQKKLKAVLYHYLNNK